MRQRRGKLRNRLLLIYLLPTGLILCGGGYWSYASTRAEVLQELGRHLVSVAQAGAGPLSTAAYASRIERLQPGMERVHANLKARLVRLREATSVRRVFLFDQALLSKADTQASVPLGSPLPEVRQDSPELQSAFAGHAVAAPLFTGADGERYLTAYAPVRDPTGEGRIVAVLGVEGSSALFASLDRLALSYASAGLVLLGLLLAVSLLVSHRITRPVAHLVEAANRIGGGDLERAVEPTGDDEIAFLGDALNEMRLAIRGREQELQLMLSGIAHEVRNPLGGMELFLGLLSEELEPHTEAAGYSARLQRELAYLKRVVNEFLDYARRVPLQARPVALGALLEDVAESCGADPVAGGCDLRVQVQPKGLRVLGDARKLRQAVLNLARNACQAMAEGGTVDLVASETKAEVRIEVVDRGPGIPVELKEQVLRPFYTTREKGTGLGLALSRKIVGEHGGRLELGDRPEGGTVVSIRLPTAFAVTASESACVAPAGADRGAPQLGPTVAADEALRTGSALQGDEEPLIGCGEGPGLGGPDALSPGSEDDEEPWLG